MRAGTIGNLAIPVAASAYAIFMVGEQLAGSYGSSTVNYALILGGCLLVLAAIVVVQSLLARRADAAVIESAPERDAMQRERYLRGVAVLVLAVLLVALFQWVGYLLGFLVFSLATLRLLKVRSIVATVAIPLGTVLVVHFLFVGFLGLPLPAGILSGIL